jgi:hypothetical protein
MKRYSLLWLNGAGGNEETLCTKADSFEGAAANFNMPASGYLKHESGGAWCVVEPAFQN